MERDQHIWQNWANALQHWGAEEIVATLLETTGPLNLLGAQVVYLGQPFLEQILPEGHTKALASILENPEETEQFTRYLRQNRQAEKGYQAH